MKTLIIVIVALLAVRFFVRVTGGGKRKRAIPLPEEEADTDALEGLRERINPAYKFRPDNVFHHDHINDNW